MTEQFDERSPIAVVCAMDWELAHLRQALPAGVEAWRSGQCAYRTTLGDQPLVLVASGLGMISAAATTQHVVSQFSPRAVLNYGCAGAHRTELLPGDVVVGTRVVAYDNWRETPDGVLEYRGMYYRAAGEQRRADGLEADPAMLAAARRAADIFVESHEPWPAHLAWPADVPHRAPRVVFGTLVSADRWNRTAASIGAIVTRHDSLCEDMEAAAIGLVCAGNGTAFLSVKDISNNELLRPTQYGAKFLEEIGLDQVARRAAAFALGVLQALEVAA